MKLGFDELHLVAAWLSPADVFRLSATCRQLYALRLSLLRQCSRSSRLCTFVETAMARRRCEPVALLLLQAITDTELKALPASHWRELVFQTADFELAMPQLMTELLRRYDTDTKDLVLAELLWSHLLAELYSAQRTPLDRSSVRRDARVQQLQIHVMKLLMQALRHNNRPWMPDWDCYHHLQTGDLLTEPQGQMLPENLSGIPSSAGAAHDWDRAWRKHGPSTPRPQNRHVARAISDLPTAFCMPHRSALLKSFIEEVGAEYLRQHTELVQHLGRLTLQEFAHQLSFQDPADAGEEAWRTLDILVDDLGFEPLQAMSEFDRWPIKLQKYAVRRAPLDAAERQSLLSRLETAEKHAVGSRPEQDRGKPRACP